MPQVYLDYAATTPVREEVRAAMVPYLTDTFGNPSSIHRWGRDARAALEGARVELAEALGVTPSEVTFVRGGTESDNLAVLGWCAARRAQGRTPHVAISALEHHAVLEAAEHAQATGLARTSKIAVSRDGTVDADALLRALSDGPTLVSFMWVNNECGAVLPIEEVAEHVATADAVLHSDAAQAVGKVPVDLSRVGVSMLSGTGHKIYGPKGTGFLVVRNGADVAPLVFGGGQERALRPGTEDVAGAVGLARAVRLAVTEQEELAARLDSLRTRLESRISSGLDGIRVNAAEFRRAPHVLSLGVADIEDGRALVMALDLEGVAVSGGSACTSGSERASHVMEALYGADDPFASLRFSFGRDTSQADVDQAAEATERVVRRMRAL